MSKISWEMSLYYSNMSRQQKRHEIEAILHQSNICDIRLSDLSIKYGVPESTISGWRDEMLLRKISSATPEPFGVHRPTPQPQSGSDSNSLVVASTVDSTVSCQLMRARPMTISAGKVSASAYLSVHRASVRIHDALSLVSSWRRSCFAGSLPCHAGKL